MVVQLVRDIILWCFNFYKWWNFSTNLTGIDIIQLTKQVQTLLPTIYIAGALIWWYWSWYYCYETVLQMIAKNLHWNRCWYIVNVSNVDLNNTTSINGGDSLDKLVITTTSGGTISATNITNVAEIDLASGGGILSTGYIYSWFIWSW